MSNTRTITSSLLVLAGALLAVACGSDDDGGGGASTDAASVEGTVWTLDELAGEAVPDGVTVTMEFDGEQIAGSGGCNQYRSSASFDDGMVSIAPEIVSTLMACPEPAAGIEQQYLAVLPDASGFEVADDELRITDVDGSMVLSFSAGGESG